MGPLNQFEYFDQSTIQLVFVVGVFAGPQKPTTPNTLLQRAVADVKDRCDNDIIHPTTGLPVTVGLHSA